MSYVEDAEKVISKLSRDKKGNLKMTTSQIRGLLSGISDIYNDVVILKSDEIPEEIQKRIMYLKVQFVYEAGREPNVKEFIEQSKILDNQTGPSIDKAITSKKEFIAMERYMEALVAYHRYHGGRGE